jgi:hypothetical protein
VSRTRVFTAGSPSDWGGIRRSVHAGELGKQRRNSSAPFFPPAAENHARLWSLIASAERHALDPRRYLTSVLAKIGTTPTGELEQFLPDVWKREDAGEPAASS